MSMDGTQVDVTDDTTVVDTGPVGFADPISPQNFEAAFAHLHSLEDTGDEIVIPTDDTTTDDGTIVDDTTTPPSTATIPPSTNVLIDGVEYPIQAIRDLVGFEQFLQSNPQAAERMRIAFDPTFQLSQPTAQQPATATPAAPTPTAQSTQFNIPEELDAEDPANKYILDRLDTITRQIATSNEIIARRESAEAEQQMYQGISTFRQKNPHLTDDDISQVRNAAASLGIFNGLVSRGTPIFTATEQSLENAMWTVDSIRNRIMTEQSVQAHANDLAQQQVETERKNKLSALGGNGTAARVPAPNDNEMVGRVPAGMLRELKAAISGGQAS